MKLVNELIKSEKHTFLVPFEGTVSECVVKGKHVKPGDILFEKKYKKVLDSFNIPSEFGIENKNLRDFITRINGEYIMKGEVIAEKVVHGGLSVKKILATHDGILSFDRLDKGCVEILSEQLSEEVISKMIGEVVDVDHSRGLSIIANSFVFRQFIPSKVKGVGEFRIIKDGHSVYSVRDLEQDYSGEVVYAGRFAYSSLVKELISRNASCVIVWSMDYTDYEEVKDHVFLLGGFGQLSYDIYIQKYITSMNESYCEVMENSIYWCDVGQSIYKDSNNDVLRNSLRVNDRVRLIDVDNFGKLGKIVDLGNETGYFIVKIETDERLLLSEECLEVIE